MKKLMTIIASLVCITTIAAPVRSLVSARTSICTSNPGVTPYDCEIEYLESDGKQIIYTDIVPLLTNTFRYKIRLPMTGSWQTTYTCYTSADEPSCLLVTWGSDIYNIGLSHFQRTSQGYAIFKSVKEDRIVEAVLSRDVGTINGVTKSLVSQSQIAAPLQLFGHSGRGGRIYYFKIDNQIDLMPVRVGDVGYLYDKISGKMFGNQGTGEFVLGPDKQ